MTPTSSVAQASAIGTPAAQHHKLEQAAQEFEGMLISSLWSGFQDDSMLGDSDDDSDAGAGSMKSLGVQAMSTALAKSGGLGLATMIVHQLTPQALKFEAGADDSRGVARAPQSATEAVR